MKSRVSLAVLKPFTRFIWGVVWDMLGTISLPLGQLGVPLPTSFQPALQIESSETCIWDKLAAITTCMVSTAFNKEMASVENDH